MTTWPILAAVALGGAFGSLLRYIVGVWLVQLWGSGFPWGTLLINLSGCFIIGLVLGITQTRVSPYSQVVRAFMAVGVLGGYTTFSTFAYDALTLENEGSTVVSVLYIVASVAGGLLAAYAGTIISRLGTAA